MTEFDIKSLMLEGEQKEKKHLSNIGEVIAQSEQYRQVDALGKHAIPTLCKMLQAEEGSVLVILHLLQKYACFDPGLDSSDRGRIKLVRSAWINAAKKAGLLA